MKTILVDDDPLGMQGFAIECGGLAEIELVGSFTSPFAALAYAQSNAVEFALLDIDMPGMDGLALYDALKKIRPDILIVFVTAHARYAVEAMRRKADYIVFKPYDKEDIEDILSRVRLLQRRQQKEIFCRTFGRFCLFVRDEPVVFKSAKAKELLALCVYRQGAPVAAAEIIDKLWPAYMGTVGNCSAFRFTVMQLTDTLKKNGVQALLGRQKSLCYLNKALFSCDYYDFLQGDANAVCAFQGSFMEEYSWAEAGLYELLEKKRLWKTQGEKATKK